MPYSVAHLRLKVGCTIVMLVLVAGTLGCGSIMARGYMEPDFSERKPPPYFYRGVASHLDEFAQGASEEPAWLLPLAFVATALDLTLCLAADTLLLPVDLAVWLGTDDASDEASFGSTE